MGDNAAPVQDLSFLAVLHLIWKRRILLAVMAISAGILGLLLSFVQTKQFRSEIVFVYDPPVSSPVQAGGVLSGLAAMMGLGASGGGFSEVVEIIKSHEMSRSYLARDQLAPLMFASRWSQESQQWKGGKKGAPTPEELVKNFEGSVRKISEDKTSGILKLAISLPDAAAVARVANSYVQMVDESMRASAVKQAEANLQLLKAELNGSNVTELKVAIARLVEMEMQKLVIAKSRQWYALHVIDAAVVPEKPYWPRATLMTVIASFFGLLLGVAYVLIADT